MMEKQVKVVSVRSSELINIVNCTFWKHYLYKGENLFPRLLFVIR